MTIAEIARTFDIPAANIRQWVKRGKVGRHPNGEVDLLSLQRWIDRDLDPDTYWRIDNVA